VFLLGHGAERVDVPLDITGNELPVPTPPALQGDKVVGVANAADALGDLRALRGEAVVLVASGFHVLLSTCSRLATTFRGGRAPGYPDAGARRGGAAAPSAAET